MRRPIALAFAMLASCGRGGSVGSSLDAGGRPPAIATPTWDGGTMTWYRDVLPIAQKRCQGCHVEGGIAPFPLGTYEEAQTRHMSMAAAVVARRMPPWMPSDDCLRFRDSRRLEQAEIDTLVKWSEQGAPMGDPADAPPAPDAGTGLPRVDATLAPDAPYTPSATIVDDYRCLVLDPRLSTDRFVVGFDIQPGERPLVHHVILYTATRSEAASKDFSTPEPGWACFGGPGTPNPTMLGGWVPGTMPTLYPQGTGIRLPADRVIVMQVHYNTAGRAPAPDRTVVSLMWQPGVAKPAAIVPMAQWTFRIPPSSTNYAATATATSPAGMLHGVLPHMHTKGKSLRVTLGGRCLIDIPRWDFGWQQFYFYADGLPLTAGENVALTCTWDNPTGRTVTWGEGTDDEMCLNYFYLTQ